MVDDLDMHRSQVDQTLRAIGLDRGGLADPNTQVHPEQEADFPDLMSRRLDSRYLGAEVGFRVDLRRTTLLSCLVYNSSDLDHALENLVRFLPLMPPPSAMRLTRTGDRVSIQLGNRNARLLVHTHYIEFCMALLVNALRRALGLTISPLDIASVHTRAQAQTDLTGL